MAKPVLQSLSDPITRDILIKDALGRIDRAYNKMLDRLNALRQDGSARPGRMSHALAAITQWRNDKRRLLLSYDTAELAEIIERIGPKGSPLPVPAGPDAEPEMDTVCVLPEGAGDEIAALLKRVVNEGWEAVFGDRPWPPQ